MKWRIGSVATRRRVFAEYADSPTLIIGTHFAGPTAGKLVRDGDTYRLDTVRAEDRQGAVRLGRTMIRCPLVLDRLEWDAESGEVVYSARPRRTASPYGTVARWDVLDFIAGLTQHIPDPSQQLVRYWGLYSNAARGKRRGMLLMLRKAISYPSLDRHDSFLIDRPGGP